MYYEGIGHRGTENDWSATGIADAHNAVRNRHSGVLGASQLLSFSPPFWDLGIRQGWASASHSSCLYERRKRLLYTLDSRRGSMRMKMWFTYRSPYRWYAQLSFIMFVTIFNLFKFVRRTQCDGLNIMWDFRFSRRRVWSLESYGM
jgi:hypothetical protein